MAQGEEAGAASADEEVPLALGEQALPATTSAHVRRVVASLATALAVTAAALSAARGGLSGVLGEKSTKLAVGTVAAYATHGPIGCNNWKRIEISRSQVADRAACAALCSADDRCTSFNWQALACEPGWAVANGCMLFNGQCETERNPCWELNFKVTEETAACPAGTIEVEGFGNVRVINSADTGGTVDIADGDLVTNMNSRSYFATAGSPCDTDYTPKPDFLALPLLGKKWSYTVDLSAAKCGCNSAMYFTAMAQNDVPGDCSGDWYCDSNAVCGTRCAEVDIQEGNELSWHSTLHTKDDGDGSEAGGIGGSVGLPAEWAGKYKPGSICIDTTKPFKVVAAFPTGGADTLTKMETTLIQGGCELEAETTYDDPVKLKAVSDALAAGMTPVISYWQVTTDGVWDPAGLSWLDTPPCPADEEDPTPCGEKIIYSDFKVEPIASVVVA